MRGQYILTINNKVTSKEAKQAAFCRVTPL